MEATYNLPPRSRITYQKHLYALPAEYAVIQNVKGVYLVVVKERKVLMVLDEELCVLDQHLKLDLTQLGPGVYVFEMVRQNKHMLLTDIYMKDNQRITSPHWCVRWNELSTLDIPRVKKFTNNQALRYDINTAKGNMIIRSVINITVDHLYCNDKPCKLLVIGTGTLRTNGQRVTLLAGNVSGQLVLVAYTKELLATRYGTVPSPEWCSHEVNAVEVFNEPQLVHLTHFDWSPLRLQEVGQFTVSNEHFQSLTMTPAVMFNLTVLPRLDDPATIVERDVAAVKSVVAFHQKEALKHKEIEASYAQANVSLL